jgi:hypothetical protein
MAFADARQFDAAEQRFQKFRFGYSAAYREAHSAHRDDMRRAREQLLVLRKRADALARLNSLRALGEPNYDGMEGEMTAVGADIVVCGVDRLPDSEFSATCARCGFVLGKESPLAALDAINQKAADALESRLSRLSQKAISRLIREHDRDGRLEGFLKIIQAAQPDALVRVLDDSLTAFLKRVLDEPTVLSRVRAPTERRAPATRRK